MFKKGPIKLAVATALVCFVFTTHLLWHRGIPHSQGKRLNNSAPNVNYIKNIEQHHLRKTLEDDREVCLSLLI